MLTMAAVVDAVCTELYKQWPGWAIYHNAYPADFNPPALLVEMDRQERRTMNKTLYEETALITVTCLAETDSSVSGGANALAEAVETLHKTFSAGYLPMDGRAVRFSLKETSFEADRCKTVFYCGFVEANVGEMSLPPMRDLHSRTKV